MSGDVKIVLAYVGGEQMLEQEQKPWVRTFQYLFSVLLSQVLGKKPNVVVLDIESEGAEREVDEAAAFVALMDESYLRHSFLVELSNRFCERMRNQKRLHMSGRHSFFKIIRRPLRSSAALSFAALIPGYNFYDTDALTGDLRTFDQRVGSSTQQAYWLKLSDVCYDLAYVLSNLSGQVEERYAKKQTVYLASVGNDMVPARDLLKRELMRRGYRVLPELSFPSRAVDIERFTNQDLQRCALSIHLVGEDYGQMISGEEESIVSLQNKIAHAHTLSVLEQRKQDRNVFPFHRLIWLDPDIENVSETQRIFIENLKSEAATIEEAEVMEVPLQEFKLIVRENLARYQAIKRDTGIEEANDHHNYVYLIHDVRDKDEVAPLASLLIDEGLELLVLSNEGTPAELRYEHQDHLRRCHGSIIYMKKASLQWLGSRIQDLFKAPAFGRQKPMRARAILFEAEVKFDFGSLKEHITILNGGGGISSATLQPFIHAIKYS